MSEPAATATDRSELFNFAASGARLLAQTQTSEECAKRHPLLVQLAHWLSLREDIHRLNLQDGTGSGLLAHLRDAWGWTTRPFEIGAEFRASLGLAGSSLNIGCAVDAEIGALILSAPLLQPPHQYTCMLLEFLRERNWLPLASQIPLWNRSNTIYTFIDLLVYDIAAQQLILIELKTGFDHAYETPICADANSGSEVFVDTHRMRHQQQLCWMQAILEADLAPLLPASDELPAVRGCIVRVSAAGGVREPDWSNDEIRAYFAQIYVRDDPAYTAN